MFNKNPIISNENSPSFLDKIIYSLEYLITIVIAIFLFTFVYFYIFRNSGEGGMIVLIIYFIVAASFDGYAARYVRKNVEKLQTKGIDTHNTPKEWSRIVLRYPGVGFCWYLACRRADFNKQIPNISSQTESSSQSLQEPIFK